MNKRQLCLPYLVKNYNQWPAKTDWQGACSHHGYNWRKQASDGPWILVSQFGDVITETDYVQHYEDNVKMSDCFSMSEELSAELISDNGDVKIAFSLTQWKALCVAVRRYDGMKAKLNHARKTIRQLGNELGE